MSMCRKCGAFLFPCRCGSMMFSLVVAMSLVALFYYTFSGLSGSRAVIDSVVRDMVR